MTGLLQVFASRFFLFLFVLAAASIIFSKKTKLKFFLAAFCMCFFLVLSSGISINAAALYAGNLYQNFELSQAAGSCNNCNVIIIVPELLRKDYTGIFSSANYTPNIDSFFSASWKFPDTYSTSVWTLPSHTSLLTGLYPNHNSVNSLNSTFPNVTTIASFLESKGYYTMSFNGGSGFYGNVNFSRDFNYSLSIRDFYSTIDNYNNINLAVQKLLSVHSKFFMLLTGFDLHFPYYNGNISKSMNYSGIFSNDLNWNSSDLNFLSLYSTVSEQCRNELGMPYAYVVSTGSKCVIINQTDINYYRAHYADSVELMDYSLKPFFNYLNNSGLLNNTVVVLMSDHGEELFEHTISHSTFYQPVVNVPLAIRIPNKTSMTFTNLVSTADIFPTLLSILGYKAPKGIDGINFLENSNKYVYGYFYNGPQRYMVTDGAEKLILENLGLTGDVELYNLKNDPNETNNLASGKSIYQNPLYIEATKFFI